MLKTDVDAFLLRDAAYVALQPVAHGHRAENLVAVDHAPVAVVDDDPVAYRALRRHQHLHLLARAHRYLVVVDEGFQFVRRHAAARHAVFVEVDYVAVAGQDASLLVAVGQKEILALQPPVQKRPVHGLVHYFQIARFARAQQRRLGRRHQTVFRVVVDEDFLAVAGFVRQRDIAVGEQHFVVFLVLKIESVVRYAADGERVVAACFEHGSWD